MNKAGFLLFLIFLHLHHPASYVMIYKNKK